MEGLGLRVSKIDAEDPYFGIFCEQGFCKPADGDSAELAQYPKESRFGDLYFLDIIKGSTLATKAKVKTDGSDPMIGHLRLAEKQMRWHPLGRIKSMLPKLLWALYAPRSVGLGDCKPFFPPSIGGLGIPLGRVSDLVGDPELRKNYASYLPRIIDLPVDQFFKHWAALQSIAMGAHKGVPWDPGSIDLGALVSKLTLTDETFKLNIPDYITRLGWQAEYRYAENEWGLIPLRRLADELSRLAAYREFWDGKTSAPRILTLSVRGMRKRFRSAWDQIRKEVEPVGDDFPFTSTSDLIKRWDEKTWGLFVSIEDPAVVRLYGGMSHLNIRWNRR